MKTGRIEREFQRAGKSTNCFDIPNSGEREPRLGTHEQAYRLYQPILGMEITSPGGIKYLGTYAPQSR